MTARPSLNLANLLTGFAWSATCVSLGISTLVLVGWTFSIQALKTLHRSSLTAMNPVTAIGLMLCAVSLALLIRRPAYRSRRRMASKACAFLVILLACVKFISYRFPIPLDIFLFSTKVVDNPMAPNTAGALLTTALALLLMDGRIGRGRRPSVALALLTACVALLALSGYIYGVSTFYRVTGYIPMAFNTAITFLLLSLAILATRPEFEPIATLLSDTAGGVVARRLLPAAAVLPLLLGWLCLLGGKEDLYQLPLRLTLYSLLTTVIFVALTWWNAQFLRKLDLDRRRAEFDAAEERHLLRTLIDNLPDIVFVKDTQHRFLLNNRTHANSLRAGSPEEMLGKSDLDYFKPEQSEQYRADERQIIATGIPIINKEQVITQPDGTQRVVSITKVPFYDTQGTPVGIVGIAHDITLRKQAEIERDRFFTMSADMICVAGFDGFFRRVNPAFETELGYTSSELTSRPWIEFVHPDDVQNTIDEGKKLGLGAVTLYFENRYACKDGTYRWLSWTAVPVVREQRIYAVARDTTERRRVEEQLRQANRKLEEAVESERTAQLSLRAAQSTMVQTEKLAGLGQMVAGVAHEINNPLSFVSNNVAVLQRELRGLVKLLELYQRADEIIERNDPPLVSDIRELSTKLDVPYLLGNLPELLTRSREGLKRIQQIVTDLRNFARLDESDLQDVNLNDGIVSTLTIINGYAKKNGIRLKTELGELPLVTCYPAKLNQVVVNLVSNAVDATPVDGQVTIRTYARDQEHVAIEVSDTGTGIEPQIRERIFDPFFTTKPPGQGTGLGLSISYGIVRDHGGTIEVDSEVGKGSTFRVLLPIKGPKASAAAASRTKTAAGS